MHPFISMDMANTRRAEDLRRGEASRRGRLARDEQRAELDGHAPRFRLTRARRTRPQQVSPLIPLRTTASSPAIPAGGTQSADLRCSA